MFVSDFDLYQDVSVSLVLFVYHIGWEVRTSRFRRVLVAAVLIHLLWFCMYEHVLAVYLLA